METVVLDYSTRLKTPGRLAAPEAVKLVAEIVFGEDWKSDPSHRERPVIKRDRAYYRRSLLKTGRGYRVRNERVPKTVGKALAAFHYRFREARRIVIEAIQVGRLTATVEPADGEAFKLGVTRIGLLRGQVNTIFATGYLRTRVDCRTIHGQVLFDEARLRKIAETHLGHRPLRTRAFSGTEQRKLRTLAAAFAEHLAAEFGADQKNWPLLRADDLVETCRAEILAICCAPSAAPTPQRSHHQFKRLVLDAFREQGLRRSGGCPAKDDAEKALKALSEFLAHRSASAPSTMKTQRLT
jgi:hypothetical protein